MNLGLWIAAALLAVVALFAGTAKTVLPLATLAAAPGGGWVDDVGAGRVRSLGVLEVLAAAGLILPAATDIAPTLVPVTAVCWALLMVGAMVTHGRRGETKPIAVNLVYLAVAVFVAVGRFGPAAF